MKKITLDQFSLLLKEAAMKPRFKRDLKFIASTEALDDATWDASELLPIWNKSKQGGVLLIQPNDNLYFLAFELTKKTQDASGRSRSIICDLCSTWQAGKAGGFVTFYPNTSTNNSTSLLCCRDLRCSDHTRTKTLAAIKSRAQLRESLNDEQRVLRLQRKLGKAIERFHLEFVD